MSSLLNLQPSAMRKVLRQARRNLSALEQKTHALDATRLLLRSPWLQRPKKIAVFLAQDGELETRNLIQALWHRQHQVYLPVVNAKTGDMTFARYWPQSELKPNRFKIDEPVTRPGDLIMGRQLDLVLVPLVGFDQQGNRLGMGGGFYDRSFSFKRHQPSRKPMLLGWAHACQEVEVLPAQPWDVPLQAIVTEKQIRTFSSHK